MAGYAVADLIANQDAKIDFFELWMQQTNTQLVPQQALQKRSAPLKQRFKILNQKLVFWEFGVRLSHFGYCDDGVYFLKEFLKVFPGREVFNNLGYCYLQMAIRKMDAAHAWFYWLPLVLDADTRAVVAARDSSSFKSLKQAASGQNQKLLEEAVAYLRRAADADPSYIPARINLAVAYLYLGRPHEARIPLLESREMDPDNILFAELEALVLYEQSDATLDLWPNAVARLKKLNESTNTSESLRFNLARMLELGSSVQESTSIWTHLAQQRNSLPTPIKMIVCTKQNIMPAHECSAPDKSPPSRSPPWQWPLNINSLQRITPDQQQRLQAWNKVDFDWFQDELYGQIYQKPDKQAQVLVLDQFVQMQVLKNNRLDTLQNLDSYCPHTLHERVLAQGTVLSCDYWAVLVRNHEIQEAWWIAE